MSTKTKAPTFPTAADIRDHIDTVICPQPQRIRDVQRRAHDAIRLLLDQDPGDTLAALVDDIIHRGDTPDPAKLAQAAQDSQRHHDNERARLKLDATHQSMNSLRLHFPTSEQNAETLDYLAGVMDQIADAARALPADTPLNAEDAIAYGDDGIELLNTVRLLVGAYGEVRRAQKKAYGNGHEALDATGHFKDATNAETYWLRSRKATAQQAGDTPRRDDYPGLVDALTYFQGTPTTPWHPIGKGHYPLNATNNEDYARFILWAARNAELWVPSLADLERQHAKNMELVGLRAWLYPAERRNIDQADIDQALASVKDREPANA